MKGQLVACLSQALRDHMCRDRCLRHRASLVGAGWGGDSTIKGSQGSCISSFLNNHLLTCLFKEYSPSPSQAEAGTGP